MVGKRISSSFIWAQQNLCGSIRLEATLNSSWNWQKKFLQKFRKKYFESKLPQCNLAAYIVQITIIYKVSVSFGMPKWLKQVATLYKKIKVLHMEPEVDATALWNPKKAVFISWRDVAFFKSKWHYFLQLPTDFCMPNRLKLITLKSGIQE